MKRVSDGNNPHVLKMLGCVTATNPMMLVLQFVPQGNLKNYLRAMKSADNVREVTVKILNTTMKTADDVRDVIVRQFMTFRYFLY